MVTTKILFLDIDGVLNDHVPHANGYNRIDTSLVLGLNRIVAATRPHIVLVSAWRYMVLGGDMTLKGFKYLLAIHGASQDVFSSLNDHLPKDIDRDINTRGLMCKNWLRKTYLLDEVDKIRSDARVVALDDLDLGYSQFKIPLVKTQSNVGLTVADEAAVVEILNG